MIVRIASLDVTFLPLSVHSATSNIYISSDSRFILKHVVKYQEPYQVYEREKFMLQRLQIYPWCPRLVSYDDENTWLIMHHCGVPLSLGAEVPRLQSQFQSILQDLKENEIEHNDIKCSELLVKNGVLYLCDFGWAYYRGTHSCGDLHLWHGDKPCGYLQDKDAIERCLQP